MDKIYIVFWTQGGNTGAMAAAVGEGVKEAGKEAVFLSPSDISGKKVALFGSYGWGDGQWMRDWEDRMNAAGATLIGGQGVIAHEAPGDEEIQACKELGKALAGI